MFLANLARTNMKLVHTDSCRSVASTSAVVDPSFPPLVSVSFGNCFRGVRTRDPSVTLLLSLITVHALSISFEVVLLLCTVPHQVGQNFSQELATLVNVLAVLAGLGLSYLFDPLDLSPTETQCRRAWHRYFTRLLSMPIASNK